MADLGIAVGLKKGWILTKREKKERPSSTKGRLGKRAAIVRDVVRELCGFAPYERRVMELLKGGGNNPQKRAWRFSKKRLGTHVRAKRKINEMANAIAKAAQQGGAKPAEKKPEKGKKK
jgi:large subunit ribosomal protein L36e